MSKQVHIVAVGHSVSVSIPGDSTEAQTFNCVSNAQAIHLAKLLRKVHDEGYIEGRNDAPQWKWGWLRNKHSTWIGVHYSPHNKRWCINLIPCFTFWITKPGGNTP
ncbi:hypothetical protein CPT_Pagan_020 [Xanthomonas phage Pagan]|uniref:Uncharacterized protein n=1 Tax=Xanthomonas phage Pagan TaxID=2591104 RepID=A0A5B9NFL8_9CAUD|nr:hypothetical protein CPT_Pagan_020 [Xanthomonas phage Pagan]